MNPYLEGADLKRLYQDWNKKVQETIPPNRLLIFNVKEGWAPLCKFLGAPVPDKPFPKANNRDEFNDFTTRDKTEITTFPKVVIRSIIKFGLSTILFGVCSYFLL